MIHIVKFTEVVTGSQLSSPNGRAAMLGYAGVDYLTACIFTQENHERVGPLWHFQLPTMHQTLELLSKAVVFMVDANFEPKDFQHHVKDLLEKYQNRIPAFASILSYPGTTGLLEGLEKSYFGVRYGECALSYDGDAWLLFRKIADELLDDLKARTNLRFPYGTLD